MAGNDRTMNLLQELEHDYESIMGIRTGMRTNSTNYYSIEEEIAYLHQRIDHINRSQIHERFRSSSTVSNMSTVTVMDASTQTVVTMVTDEAGVLHDRWNAGGLNDGWNTGGIYDNNRDVNSREFYPSYHNGNMYHQNGPTSKVNRESPTQKRDSSDNVVPCHFCGGSGVDLSQFDAYKWANGEIPFDAPFHPKMTQTQNNTYSHDNKRHISWAFIDIGANNSPKVSHIHLELSTSPLQTIDDLNKSDLNGRHLAAPISSQHQNQNYYHPSQLSEGSSQYSYSESELDLPKEEESEDFTESESGTDDYVTLRRSNFTYRHPSFGTSVECFADGEDNYNGSGDQDGEVSPFVNFVSKLDNQEPTGNLCNEDNVPRVKEQKRILKPSYKKIGDRRPTPGPTGYLNNIPRNQDGKQLDDDVNDIDLNDPELNEAAIKMQAAFKGFNTRKKMGVTNNAKPDSNMATHSKRPIEANEEIDIDLNDPEVEMAAVKMQAAFKGFSARKKMGPKKNNDRKNPVVEPDIVMQKSSDLHSALPNGDVKNPNQKGTNEELDEIDLEDPELAAAATKMQAAFKGFNARKKMGLAKNKKSIVGEYKIMILMILIDRFVVQINRLFNFAPVPVFCPYSLNTESLLQKS